MLIGAHLSIQKGLIFAARRLSKIGGNVLQIFSSPPRNWKKTRFSEKELMDFRKSKDDIGIKKVFLHAKYLINIASKDKRIRSLSVGSLLDDLRFSEKIEAEGVIFHPHLSHGKEKVIKTIKEILKEFKGKSFLILENSAGDNLEDYLYVFERIEDDRIKFCLDLAHVYQNGIDLNNPARLKEVFNFLLKNFKDKIFVIHSNNSKTKLASKHDVHANIEEGKISPQAFFVFLNHPLTCKLPFILETPGFKEKDGRSDRKNIQALLRLKGQRLKRDFFERSAEEVAQDLLGKYLVLRKEENFFAGRVFETEAYVGPEDKASHAYGNKKTQRTKVMFEEGGKLYVYMIYGMYYCLNVVTGKKGYPSAVLIRGIEPVYGDSNPLDGPGKICRELGITTAYSGIDTVSSSEIYFVDIGLKPKEIFSAPRIGVDYAEEWAKKKLRFIAKF